MFLDYYEESKYDYRTAKDISNFRWFEGICKMIEEGILNSFNGL